MQLPLKKLLELFGEAAQLGEFGALRIDLLNVDVSRLIEAAAWLRMEESFRMDFLENASVFEKDGKLLFTYFIRSFSKPHRLVLRSSVPAPVGNEWVDFPSLVRIWPQAEAFESEMEILFGVRFADRPPNRQHLKNFGKFDGFPLRKSFEWGEGVDL
ncbi:MAG: NADH-quinone oxidoreductase subunit C [Cryobacterium sp.]|nr:NADH-quinone oxidoreductase subunit C [Oligoflexia bacterium]